MQSRQMSVVTMQVDSAKVDCVMYARVRLRSVDDNLDADAFDFYLYFVTIIKRVFTNCT
jgi:hypothetical protein